MSEPIIVQGGGATSKPQGPPPPPPMVRVGTVTYRISNTPEDWANADHPTRKVGESDHVNAVIRLRPGMAPDTMRLTLWHEVLHAIMWSVLGGPMWDHLGEDEEAREELVVSRLEHPTLAVLRDNPALVHYLMGEA